MRELKKQDVYMVIGNGTKNQFRDLRKINGLVTKLLKDIPRNSAFLYFGDSANKKNPDVGYLFQLIKEKRSDIKIFMIQIAEAKSWGVAKFVNKVYWHTSYTKECKWGGIHRGKPCSNTAKWVSINNKLAKSGSGIKKVFIFGGGPITLDEFSLIKKYKIAYKYFPVERKYNGDKKTKITNGDSMKTRVGVTYGKIPIV